MTLLQFLSYREFTFEFLTMEAIFCLNFKRRDRFFLRIVLSTIAILIVSQLTIIDIRLYSIWSSLPHFIIIPILSILAMQICFINTSWERIFVCMAAYASQCICFSIYIILKTVFLTSNSMYSSIVLYLFTLTMVVLTIFYLFARRMRYDDSTYINSRQLIILTILELLIDNVFKFYMLTNGIGQQNIGVFIIWKGLSAICCALILYLQFELLRQSFIKSNYIKLEELIYKKQNQYEIAKHDIDFINIKIHDLKHKIQEIEKQNGELYSDALKEITNAMMIYDSSIKTGNEPLDVILTEKSLNCERNSINLNCIADGSKLAFIDIIDLYSLFGNIIDNAFEAVNHLQDKTKRTINLVVKANNGFLSIHSDNYFDGEIVLENGLPKTTKAIAKYHGFGLKSVRMIVESYGGDLSITAKDGIFSLNVLMFIPEST